MCVFPCVCVLWFSWLFECATSQRVVSVEPHLLKPHPPPESNVSPSSKRTRNGVPLREEAVAKLQPSTSTGSPTMRTKGREIKEKDVMEEEVQEEDGEEEEEMEEDDLPLAGVVVCCSSRLSATIGEEL